MARQIHYNAAEHISADTAADPYLRPAFSLKNRLLRLTWNFVWLLFCRFSPRPFHAWRSLVLRLYGAKLGPRCHFYPRARIWAPWNLTCGRNVTVADDAEIYNPAPATLGDHAILSQSAYVCGATHDYDDPAFPLLGFAIHIGERAWVCARASVAPGVKLGDGAVLGLGSVATRDLDPWTIYAGVPAVRVKDRKHPA
jgi:putative colanic acid biosynthesis acetyltransferase WcaF